MRTGFDGVERSADLRGRMCERKARFPDEYVARARAAQLIEQGRADRPQLWVYQCPVCRGWHMTGARYLNRGSFSVTAGDMFTDTSRPKAA